jgi:hypothetical protein
MDITTVRSLQLVRKKRKNRSLIDRKVYSRICIKGENIEVNIKVKYWKKFGLQEREGGREIRVSN